MNSLGDQYRHPAGRHGRVLTVVNGKGGTNKTTTVTALAAMSAQAGQRVLLIDADDQGTATKWLGHSLSPRLYEALDEGNKALDALAVGTSVPGLEIVPASGELKDADARLGSKAGIQNALRDALADTSARDLVIIDTPGDIGLMTIMALIAAGEALVTMPPESPVYAQLPETEQLIHDVQRRANRDLSFLGVLATAVPTFGAHESVEARNIMADLQEHRGGILLPVRIHRSTLLGLSYDNAQAITEYAPDSKPAKEYWQVAQLLGLVPAQESVHG